jgi:hypothetical protein
MNIDQKKRLELVKEKLTLVTNLATTIQSDVGRAEEAPTDEEAELLIALTETNITKITNADLR